MKNNTNPTTQEAFPNIDSHYSSTRYHHCECGMAVGQTGHREEDNQRIIEHLIVFHDSSIRRHEARVA